MYKVRSVLVFLGWKNLGKIIKSILFKEQQLQFNYFWQSFEHCFQLSISWFLTFSGFVACFSCSGLLVSPSDLLLFFFLPAEVFTTFPDTWGFSSIFSTQKKKSKNKITKQTYREMVNSPCQFLLQVPNKMRKGETCWWRMEQVKNFEYKFTYD